MGRGVGSKQSSKQNKCCLGIGVMNKAKKLFFSLFYIFFIKKTGASYTVGSTEANCIETCWRDQSKEASSGGPHWPGVDGARLGEGHGELGATLHLGHPQALQEVNLHGDLAAVAAATTCNMSTTPPSPLWQNGHRKWQVWGREKQESERERVRTGGGGGGGGRDKMSERERVRMGGGGGGGGEKVGEREKDKVGHRVRARERDSERESGWKKVGDRMRERKWVRGREWVWERNRKWVRESGWLRERECGWDSGWQREKESWTERKWVTEWVTESGWKKTRVREQVTESGWKIVREEVDDRERESEIESYSELRSMKSVKR